jgi:beta-glucosidase/6-phospho-beta-glucosidase/beta-galactosidase
MNNLIRPEPENFLFAGGIEDTFVPQVKDGHRALDEYALMGHYRHWREDLRLAHELGLQALRWGVPWYKVEPSRGKFDWSWTDEVIPFMVEELRITPIIDLIHYGCPFWLEREFANNDYPSFVADYCAAFANRYKDLVKFYTPLNEPIINSLMCGLRGLWPPYLKGERGYLKIMLQIARGIQQSVRAIKSVDDNAVMVYVEATGLTRAIRDDLHSLAVEETRRGYLCFDLITGNFKSDHPLYAWILRNGFTPDNLIELHDNPVKLDVVGMNFYPQWSTKQIYQDRRGRIKFRDIEPEGDGFTELIESYYKRYQAPIMITETSAVGGDEIRSRWLGKSLEMVKQLRAKGVPVIGYTWFPIFTMIDWRYRFSSEPLAKFYLELGIYKLNQSGCGKRWLETPLVEQMKKAVGNPAQSVGALNMSLLQNQVEEMSEKIVV